MDRVVIPFDCDSAPRPVRVRAVDCPSLLTIPPHSHTRAELVYVCTGTVCVTADGTAFTVSAQNAILIPPDTLHDMQMLSDACLLTVYLTVPPDKPYNKGCSNILVSNLLRELMQAALSLPVTYDSEGREGRIMELMAEEVSWLMSQSPLRGLQTPVPKNPRLLRLCRDVLRDLDQAWTIDDAARTAGMGRRTFTRTFRREAGISFSAWRLRARLNGAVLRLNSGASVTEVAFESGYNSPSAFATMFKRYLGFPPSDYQAAAAGNRELLNVGPWEMPIYARPH